MGVGGIALQVALFPIVLLAGRHPLLTFAAWVLVAATAWMPLYP